MVPYQKWLAKHTNQSPNEKSPSSRGARVPSLIVICLQANQPVNKVVNKLIDQPKSPFT